MFEFKILAKDKSASRRTKARVGEFHTPHGELITPEIAFVATEAEIKSIPKEILPGLPVNYCIVNTFHTFVKNIIPSIEKKQGVHRYLNYKNIVATDSGGFQVFSLGFGKSHRVGKLAKFFARQTKVDDSSNPLKITDKGVTFSYENKKFLLNPEISITLQQRIGADIMFAFDECTSPLNSKKYTEKALERTHHWLTRCIKSYQLGNGRDRVGTLSTRQALFGIIQGGHFLDLRTKSAKFVAKQDVQGFGIGGSLGRSKDDLWHIVDWVTPLLPEEKPRHLLGVGQVRDIFEAVERGVDLFDCVIPTREARHKVLYTNHGRVNIRKFRNLNEVADKSCLCLACTEKLTYRQLNELFQLRDPRAFYFATVHNIQFYSDLMKNIRAAIVAGKIRELKEKVLTFY